MHDRCNKKNLSHLRTVLSMKLFHIYICGKTFFTPISVQIYKYPYTTQERYAINKYYAP